MSTFKRVLKFFSRPRSFRYNKINGFEKIFPERSVPFFSRAYGHGRKPWNLQLAQSILTQDPSLVFAPEKDSDRQNELRTHVFKDLELERQRPRRKERRQRRGVGRRLLPATIQDVYPDMSSYQDALSRLVVEETISTIGNSLDRMGLTTEKERKETVRRGVVVCITDKDAFSNFVECYSYNPLTRLDRNNLRAGAVVYLLPKGTKEFSPEKAILGIIQ